MPELRLRSPIFDHGAVGLPVRRSVRKTIKEEQELSEFKVLSCALLQAHSNSIFTVDKWKEAAKLVSFFFLHKMRRNLEVRRGRERVEGI
jgi:hypothetical protein